MNRGRRAAAALLVATLALGGCSILSFVYERLDSITTSLADRWFDLGRDQEKRFKALLRDRLELNRREELPRYAAWLRDVAGLAGRSPTAEEVAARLDQAKSLLDEGVQRTVPAMAELLADLEPAQVDHFQARADDALAEDIAEWRETPASERAEDRRRELVKEAERWTGRLRPEQRAVLHRLADAIPDGSERWFETRRKRTRDLVALLRGRPDAAACARFINERWLAEGDDAERARDARTRALTAAAIAELVGTLDARQRERVASRLVSIAEELESLHRKGRDDRKG